VDNGKFANVFGLPDELIPFLIGNWTCEYASFKRDGTPVTMPVIPFPGEDGRTIDVNTGLAYPTKAERARNNPKVCLLYSEPKGAVRERPPVILVYGQATVHDADLQANTDRYIRGFLDRMKALKFVPRLFLSNAIGYLARIWVAITPLKILWWPEGEMDQEARIWLAPEGTTAPPSDPKPAPLSSRHPQLVVPNPDCDGTIASALERLGAPVLTVSDEGGYPVPFRTRAGFIESSGLRLELLPSMPVTPRGRACLTFHTLGMSGSTMLSNENITLIGEVNGDDRSALFRVERALPGVDFKTSLKGFVNLIRVIQGFKTRLEAEAERRGQPVPTLRLPGEY
jgi:hypothetical protein